MANHPSIKPSKKNRNQVISRRLLTKFLRHLPLLTFKNIAGCFFLPPPPNFNIDWKTRLRKTGPPDQVFAPPGLPQSGASTQALSSPILKSRGAGKDLKNHCRKQSLRKRPGGAKTWSMAVVFQVCYGHDMDAAFDAKLPTTLYLKTQSTRKLPMGPTGTFYADTNLIAI